jgi:hypothetical protein
MEKTIKTGKIITQEEVKTIYCCDFCEKEFIDRYKTPITFNNVHNSWGDCFGVDLDFCSLSCMNKYYQKEKISEYNEMKIEEGITIIINDLNEYNKFFSMIEKIDNIESEKNETI